MAALGDEDIGGLDVAVDDALSVRGFEGVGDFDADGDEAFDFERLPEMSAVRVEPSRYSMAMKLWSSCLPIS